MLPPSFFNKLMEFEGEYSNHPNDGGGGTIYGITIKYDEYAFKLIKRYFDLNRKEHAKEIARIVYDIDYYEKAGCYSMVNNLILSIIIHQVFDMAVNMGVKRSIKTLQKAINTYNKNTDVVVDGSFGEKTLTALKKVNTKEFNNVLVKERISYYENIVKINPDNAVFINGWKNRANWFKVKDV